MDALAVLREQAANADRIIGQVFSPVTPEQAAWRLPGSLANTIGATFMHVYFSEDRLIHEALGVPTIFERGDWREVLGYDHESVWTYAGPHRPERLRTYAEAVWAATSAYLSGLAADALDETVDTPRGPQPRATRLWVYLVNHKFQHVGDIAALLGCQGVKGLPF